MSSKSSSRATREHISRHTFSAPAPYLQKEDSLEDIEQLLEQMRVVDTPIQTPGLSSSPLLCQSVSKDSPTPSRRPSVPLQRIPHPPSAPTPQPPYNLPQYSLSSKQIARYSVNPKPPLKPLSHVPSPRTTRIVLTKKQGARPLRLPVTSPST